jgi:cell fate regulator YaaT (PSP1 superfamily)
MAMGFAEVHFKGTRKDYFSYTGHDLVPGDHVVVQADRGEDLGEVTAVGLVAQRKCASTGCSTRTPERRVLRVATPEEVQRVASLRADEERIRGEARELVARRGLKMKVTEAEWQFDRNRLILYFTAERRVDFRELVRDLARAFRTRIELRQIGVRDEAALLGGVGRCGRELCSSTWLPELKPVSLQLAKDQRLSLNPSQISGLCGRLMCCLMYEHKTYVDARRRFPREGKTLRTSRGEEKVVNVDILQERLTLRDGEGERRTVSLEALRQEVGGSFRGEGRGRRGKTDNTERADAGPAPTTEDAEQAPHTED